MSHDEIALRRCHSRCDVALATCGESCAAGEITPTASVPNLTERNTPRLLYGNLIAASKSCFLFVNNRMFAGIKDRVDLQ